jgi:hypothetical protein
MQRAVLAALGQDGTPRNCRGIYAPKVVLIAVWDIRELRSHCGGLLFQAMGYSRRTFAGTPIGPSSAARSQFPASAAAS